MKTFRQFLLKEKQDLTIYCDMDGVLVNFQKRAREVLGRDIDDPFWKGRSDEKWDIILSTKNFWLDMEEMPDARELWNYINQFTPFILSATPKIDADETARQKTKWCKEHFNISADRVFIVRVQFKRKFALNGRTGSPNILIDDNKDNIKQWRTAGGIGILHISAKDTTSKLKNL